MCAAGAAFAAVEHAYGMHAGWYGEAPWSSSAARSGAAAAVDSSDGRALLRAIALQREAGAVDPGAVLTPSAGVARQQLVVSDSSAAFVRESMLDPPAAGLQCVWSAAEIARGLPAKRRADVSGDATRGILGVDQGTFIDDSLLESPGVAALARAYQCTTHYMTCYRKQAAREWWPWSAGTSSAPQMRRSVLSLESSAGGSLRTPSQSAWSVGAADAWVPLAPQRAPPGTMCLGGVLVPDNHPACGSLFDPPAGLRDGSLESRAESGDEEAFAVLRAVESAR